MSYSMKTTRRLGVVQLLLMLPLAAAQGVITDPASITQTYSFLFGIIGGYNFIDGVISLLTGKSWLQVIPIVRKTPGVG